MTDKTFWVYGLTCPCVYDSAAAVFYVGYTCNPWQRFASHWAARGDCSSYRVIRYWKHLGQKFGHRIFGEFDNEVDAKRLERALVRRLPALVNNTSQQALLSDWMYPATERDKDLLARALSGADFTDRGDIVDTSGDYVDERYDDLDLIEAP